MPWAMLLANQTTGSDLLVSGQDKQALFEMLCHKNSIRRRLGGRQIDIPTVYRRKVKLMTEDRFMQLLEPILVEKFGAVDWPTGFTPRLLLAVRLHKDAIAEIQENHGIADPRTQNPDMLQIIERLAPKECRH
ncbi:hypothetical protein ASD8599_01386 [Ascidiaceihabitans donghaensis]|uniref:Uncharacterized protein n=1 Tax=Ascidiaceihabitans donghaensis TaxID=1510460 RepID=A0A2R8BCI7_9RHOB|nr:hypothetical protein [Ascidiaceihabitans donghaensis]SPH20647.1 hypothetical protein ASD8599_01386 [Ascidiaceihabitans donghaensis]